MLFAGRKRQRTERLDAVLASLSGEEDDDNPFWDGDGADDGAQLDGDDGEDVERASPPPGVLTRGKAPVSPPPSNRRRPVAHKQSGTVADVDTPRTPENKLRLVGSSLDMPVRDSGNNPFLDDDSSPMSIVEGANEPETPTDIGEKPTISYVL